MSTAGSELKDFDFAPAWLLALERAVRTSDWRLANRAEQQLERLGFVVRVVRPMGRTDRREEDRLPTSGRQDPEEVA